MSGNKRRSRGLVVGHLERISSSAFDEYNKVITDLVAGSGGIYALYRNNQLYYVGLAGDLKRRVRQHLKDRHAGKWNYFSLYLVRAAKYLQGLESLAIRLAWPKGNRMRGSFRGARDLRKSLKRDMTREAMKKIGELMGRPQEEAPQRWAAAKPKRSPTGTRNKRKLLPLKWRLRDKRLKGTHAGKEYRARVLPSGRIKLLDTGRVYDSPTAAARAIVKRSVNGWLWWRYRDSRRRWASLVGLRMPSRRGG